MEQSITSPASSLEPGLAVALIAQEDLHVSWPIVLPGLREVCKRSGNNWIPEDVYANLRAGSSFLYLAYRHGDYAGFFVLTPLSGWDGRVMHIWAAYGAQRGVVDAFFPEVERIARQAGARRLTFWSKRRWDRKIERHGMRPFQTEFAKEL